jgi:hypothetical protein
MLQRISVGRCPHSLFLNSIRTPLNSITGDSPQPKGRQEGARNESLNGINFQSTGKKTNPPGFVHYRSRRFNAG